MQEKYVERMYYNSDTELGVGCQKQKKKKDEEKEQREKEEKRGGGEGRKRGKEGWPPITYNLLVIIYASKQI